MGDMTTEKMTRLERALRNIAFYTGEGPSTTPWQDIVCYLSQIAREALAPVSIDDEAVVDKLVSDRMKGVTSRAFPVWQPRITMPDDGGTFLVANAKGQVAPKIRRIIHNNVGTAYDWNYGEAITHWMPLPSAPNGGEQHE